MLLTCVSQRGGISEKWFVNCQCWKNSQDDLVYFCHILFCPANLSSFHPSPRGEGWRQSEISLKEASSVPSLPGLAQPPQLASWFLDLLPSILLSSELPQWSTWNTSLTPSLSASWNLHEQVQLPFRAHMALCGRLLPNSQALAPTTWVPATVNRR